MEKRICTKYSDTIVHSDESFGSYGSDTPMVSDVADDHALELLHRFAMYITCACRVLTGQSLRDSPVGCSRAATGASPSGLFIFDSLCCKTGADSDRHDGNRNKKCYANCSYSWKTSSDGRRGAARQGSARRTVVFTLFEQMADDSEELRRTGLRYSGGATPSLSTCFETIHEISMIDDDLCNKHLLTSSHDSFLASDDLHDGRLANLIEDMLINTIIST